MRKDTSVAPPSCGSDYCPSEPITNEVNFEQEMILEEECARGRKYSASKFEVPLPYSKIKIPKKKKKNFDLSDEKPQSTST